MTPALTPIGQVPHFSGSSWLQLRLEDEDSVRHATELEMEVSIPAYLLIYILHL